MRVLLRQGSGGHGASYDIACAFLALAFSFFIYQWIFFAKVRRGTSALPRKLSSLILLRVSLRSLTPADRSPNRPKPRLTARKNVLIELSAYPEVLIKLFRSYACLPYETLVK
jgi:hypothetical protein